MILYKPPTLWGLLRGAAINLLLPFINGLMLGFGELFAHEAAFRLGWGGTKVGSSPLLNWILVKHLHIVLLLWKIVMGTPTSSVGKELERTALGNRSSANITSIRYSQARGDPIQ